MGIAKYQINLALQVKARPQPVTIMPLVPFVVLVVWDETQFEHLEQQSIQFEHLEQQTESKIHGSKITVKEFPTKWGPGFLINVNDELQVSRYGMVELRAKFSHMYFSMQFWGKDSGSFQQSGTDFGVMYYAPTLDAMQSKIDNVKKVEGGDTTS